MSDRRKGILCIVASAFGFATMAFFVRLCDDYGSPVSCFQKSFFRNLIALVLAAVAFSSAYRARGRSVMPSRAALWPLIARVVLGTIGIFANFHALSHIPIAEGQTLNKIAPFVTVLAAWIFMGERMTAKQMISLVVAFAGVVFVMKPGWRPYGSAAAAIGFSSGVAAGLAYAFLHRLGRLGVAPSAVVFAFSLFSCLASIPFVIGDFTPMTMMQIVILLAAGAAAALGQFGITAAYWYAEPREIVVYDYSNILFTAAYGFTFFGQIPDVLSVVGFVLIILAALRMHR